MSLMENLGIKKIVTADKHFDLNKNIERITKFIIIRMLFLIISSL